MVAIRSTHGIEAPIASNGRMIVTSEVESRISYFKSKILTSDISVYTSHSYQGKHTDGREP